MSKHSYKPLGTCSMEIKFDLIEGCVRNIEFVGGCSGNLKGMAALADGMDANGLANRLSGIVCGAKSTSCPDQLAKAVTQALKKTND